MSDVGEIPDNELIKRVISGLSGKVRGRKSPLWVRVSDTFCLGSTYSSQLCRKHGYDPEKLVGR